MSQASLVTRIKELEAELEALKVELANNPVYKSGYPVTIKDTEKAPSGIGLYHYDDGTSNKQHKVWYIDRGGDVDYDYLHDDDIAPYQPAVEVVPQVVSASVPATQEKLKRGTVVRVRPEAVECGDDFFGEFAVIFAVDDYDADMPYNIVYADADYSRDIATCWIKATDILEIIAVPK